MLKNHLNVTSYKRECFWKTLRRNGLSPSFPTSKEKVRKSIEADMVVLCFKIIPLVIINLMVLDDDSKIKNDSICAFALVKWSSLILKGSL